MNEERKCETVPKIDGKDVEEVAVDSFFAYGAHTRANTLHHCLHAMRFMVRYMTI